MFLPYEKPEECGIGSNAILDFINVTENESEINLKTFILIKDKKIITEFEKQPYTLNEQQMLFSMTKSFSALAVGIAHDKGLLNLDDKVISYFQDKLPVIISSNLREIRITDLLTMTSGIHENTYGELYPQKDWIKAFLAQDFPHKPGSYYRYSTHGSHMLSAIVEKVSGMSLIDFLNENLFIPMNISRPQWEVAPDGYTAGGMGLSLSTESIAKVGLMLLDKGMYHGNRILSEDFIIKATTSQVFKHSDIDKTEKEYSGSYYGYQLHIGKHEYFRMDGAFGQLCLVVPDKKMVVVATSIQTKTEKLLKLIYEYLLYNNISLKGDDSYYPSLRTKTPSLSYWDKKSNLMPMRTFQHKNKYFEFNPNKNNIDKVLLCLKDEGVVIKTAKNNGLVEEVKAKYESTILGEGFFVKDIQHYNQKYASRINWINVNTFEVEVRYTETPYVTKYLITLENDTCSIEFSINVSFTLKKFSAYGRKLENNYNS